MPEGLENDFKPAELADVFAFLARSPASPKELAGNRPQTVAPGPGRLDSPGGLHRGHLRPKPDF